MLIKREGKLFIVYEKREYLFRSFSFDECKKYVFKNGGFDEARKKIKERSNSVG